MLWSFVTKGRCKRCEMTFWQVTDAGKRAFRCVTRFSDSLPPVLMMIGQYLQGQLLLTYWGKADRKESVAVELIVSINIHNTFFPRILPQCRIHGPGVSQEFSTNHPPQAELLHQQLNRAIHPRGSTKMSLFDQPDCSVWISFTEILEMSSIN